MSKETKKYKVYKHTSPSGKVYIGITSTSVEKRWQNGKGYKSHKYFYSAISKYGWENIIHEIVADNLSRKEACKMEVELIKKYNSTNRLFGYNQSIGGESGACGVHPSQETLEKLRKASTGRKRGKEELEKFSAKMKGHIVTEETRKKISEALKNKIKNKSVYYNKENGCKDCGKPTLCIETGEIFASAMAASRHIGLSKTAVWNVVIGRKKTAGGYHWKYYEEDKNE